MRVLPYLLSLSLGLLIALAISLFVPGYDLYRIGPTMLFAVLMSWIGIASRRRESGDDVNSIGAERKRGGDPTDN